MRYEIVLMMEEDYSGKMARIFLGNLVKFICSEKATKFFEISTIDLTVTKGQLISKCPFGVIVWTKIPTKFFSGFLL